MEKQTQHSKRFTGGGRGVEYLSYILDALSAENFIIEKNYTDLPRDPETFQEVVTQFLASDKYSNLNDEQKTLVQKRIEDMSAFVYHGYANVQELREHGKATKIYNELKANYSSQAQDTEKEFPKLYIVLRMAELLKKREIENGKPLSEYIKIAVDKIFAERKNRVTEVYDVYDHASKTKRRQEAANKAWDESNRRREITNRMNEESKKKNSRPPTTPLDTEGTKAVPHPENPKKSEEKPKEADGSSEKETTEESE